MLYATGLSSALPSIGDAMEIGRQIALFKQQDPLRQAQAERLLAEARMAIPAQAQHQLAQATYEVPARGYYYTSLGTYEPQSRMLSALGDFYKSYIDPNAYNQFMQTLLPLMQSFGYNPFGTQGGTNTTASATESTPSSTTPSTGSTFYSPAISPDKREFYKRWGIFYGLPY